MSITQQIITIAMCIIGTMITRFLPFIIFPAHKKTPKTIQYLGDTLAFSVMGLLVVYCLKDVSFAAYPFGAAEIISILFIITLHIYKRNMLLSISAGTFLYMFLIQYIF